MRLFRDHLGLGSWLALTALALNLALSFGHYHWSGGDRRLVLAVAVASSDGGDSGHRDDGFGDDRCPICMATAAIGTAFSAAAPSLPHPVAHVLVDRAAGPVRVLVGQLKAAFQSRAPPVS
jgi:hypothetical protein